MEDRYLFRAKRIDNGEWAEGYLFRLSENHPPFIMLSDRYGESHEVDPSTICQCTGRTDRDEKLIFEHDVIAYLDPYSTESGYAEADCAGEVLWDEETLSFQVTNRLSAESWEVLGGECKVLGNAIEHPELLEV